MKNCQECGLPVPVCNALTNYRLANEAHHQLKYVSYENYVKSAKKFYEQYLRERHEPKNY